MELVSRRQPDIILTGIQSGTVPYSYNNLRYLTSTQLDVLLGILPDLVVLCVNIHDDIAYMKRTVLTIENYINTHVLCCMVYTMTNKNTLFLNNNKVHPFSDEINNFVEMLDKEISIPIFVNERKSVGKAVDLIVDYLTEI